MINDILTQAKALGACKLADKPNTLKDLATLFFSPQGLEFCENNRFPDADFFMNYRDQLKQCDIYAYAGNAGKFFNPQAIAFVGDTFAQVSCFGVERAYKILLMHGAKAKILASNYAVVRVVALTDDCEVEIINDDTAKIIW